MSARFPDHQMRVVSAGVGAYGTVQERILIENDLLDLKPDVLVMFSGWNDTYFGYAGKDIRRDQDYMDFRARLGEETKTRDMQTFSEPRIADCSLKLQYLVDRLIYRLTVDEKGLSKDVAATSLPPDVVVQTLQRNVNIVVDISRRHGFDFVFYLQPTLYRTDKKLTEWERNMLQRNSESLVGFADYNRLLYVRLRSELKEDAAREGY